MNTSGESHFVVWHVPQCRFVIEYSRILLAEIEQVVLESFYSAPRGGLETAGLLFGIHLEGVLRITAFRPMECEHLHGPGFLVSDKDLIGLSALLERSSRDPLLHNSTLVGWYHSHTRSGIFLSEADLELHRRFFPESWQVALVLCPSLHTATRAGFFFTEADGTVRGEQSYREFELAEAEPASLATHVARLPGQPARRAEPGLAPSPKPALIRANPPTEAPARHLPVSPPAGAIASRVPPLEPVGKSKSRYWPWVVAGLVLGIGGASWYQSGTARPPSPVRVAPLHLRVTDQAGVLQIEWDKNTLASTVLLGGNLGIRDGETRMDLALDRTAIKAGSFRVSRHSPNVRVTLQVRVLGAAPIMEVAEFSGPVPQPVEAAEAIDGKAAAETPAVQPEANRVPDKLPEKQPGEERLADGAFNTKDQRDKHERSSFTPSGSPFLPPVVAAPANVAAPPRQQTMEAALPPAPAVSSPARPPADTPLRPAASQPAQSTPSVPRPVPPASQPATSAAAGTAAPAAPTAPNIAPAAVQPPKPILARLSGHWVHGADAPTGSPFPPESLSLTLNESGGQLRGSFSGSYKVPKDRKGNGRIDFEFAGPAGAGSARFPFNAADGSKGEVEIIRLPGHLDTIEVVWHSSRDRITFDDVFQRVP